MLKVMFLKELWILADILEMWKQMIKLINQAIEFGIQNIIWFEMIEENSVCFKLL